MKNNSMSLLKKLNIERIYAGIYFSIEKMFKRFPFATITILIWMVGFYNIMRWSDRYNMNLFYPSSVLFFALIGIELLSEKLSLSLLKKNLFKVFSVFIAIFYYFSFPTTKYVPNYHYIRFVLFLLLDWAFISIAFFDIKADDNDVSFWFFNKEIVVTFLLSILDVVILFAGLSLALYSLELLFNIELPQHSYEKLFAFIAGVFGMTYFLAHIPDKNEILQGKEMPKWILFMSKFIFLPIVIVYFLILYVYMLKIIILMNWPKGMVTSLCMWYSLIVMLIYAFNYIITEKENFAKVFNKYVFYTIIPVVIMALLAIRYRIKHYGITELRYLGIFLSIWFIINSFYFLLRKKNTLKFIPISLLFFILVVVFIPYYNVVNMSINSQMQRLEQLLAKNGFLKNGKLIRINSEKSIDKKDKEEIDDKIRYLIKNHGFDLTIKKIATDPLIVKVDSLLKANSYSYSIISEISKYIGLNKVNVIGSKNDYFYYYRLEEPFLVDIKGFDIECYFVGENVVSAKNRKYSYKIKNDSMLVVMENESVILQFSLLPLLHRLKEEYGMDNHNVPAEELILYAENKNYVGKAILNSLSKGNVDSASVEVQIYNLFLRKKD